MPRPLPPKRTSPTSSLAAMTRFRRALTTVASLGVALLLVSCGVEAGDAATPTSGGSTQSGSTTPTDPGADLTPEQQQLADTMAKAYEDLGFTDEEATCLSEGIARTMDGSTPDMSGLMDVVNQCDIPIDRLMEIQGSMGDGSADSAFKESMATGLEASGLSEEDATCVADKLVDQYGMDIEALTDPQKVQPIAEDCGVDPSSIRPGG